MLFHALLLVSPGAIVTGCGTDAGESAGFVESDSAGVAVAYNAHPAADTVRLAQPAVRIGSDGFDAHERDTFEWISDIDVLAGGRVVVVDNRAPRVAVFDAGGEWLRDVGREGEGPGEYRGPLTVQTAGGTLVVWDVLARRFSRFSASGEFLGSTALREKSDSRPIRMLPDGYIDELESGQYDDPAPARGVLVRRAAAGEIMDTLAGPFGVPEIGLEVVDEERGIVGMVNPPRFAVYPAWSMHGDALVLTRPLEPRIEVRDRRGELRRLIELPRPTGAPTPADRDAYFDALQDRFGLTGDEIARERPETRFAEARPAITDVLVDDAGRVWVAEFDPANFLDGYIGSEWDVLDADGRLVRRVVFPARFRPLRIRRDRVYGLRTTELDVHVIEVYELAAG